MKRLVPKNQFICNVLTLMTGSGFAQIIAIAISPILTRIYTPEDFGILALYMSITSIAAVISTGRYELAIMLPRKDTDAIHILVLSVSIAIALGCICFFIVILFGELLSQTLGYSFLESWLYIVPVIIIIAGLSQSLNNWNNRKSNYKILAKSHILKGGLTSGTQLGCGFFLESGKGLIIGSFIGFFSTLFYLLSSSRFQKIKINKSKIFVLAKKYRKFPLFNLPNALADSFRMSSVFFIISMLFTANLLGQFMLAWRMVALPTSLITGSISQPFYQKISTASPSNAYVYTKKMIIQMVKISFFIYLALFLFSPSIFMIVFGSEWEVAGKLTSVLVPWLFLNFITSPLGHIYTCYNKQNIMLLYSVVYMLIPITCMIIMQGFEFMTALSVTSIFMCLFLIMYTYRTMSFLKKIANND